MIMGYLTDPFDMMGMTEEELAGFMAMYLGSMLLSFAISAVWYILNSMGLYTIAKNREIKNPWLAWIPVGSAWILGSISDQYQYVVKGRERNKRKSLLILQAVLYVALVVVMVLCFSIVGDALKYGTSGNIPESVAMQVGMTALAMVGVYLVMMGVAIANMIIAYIAEYDLYRSCDPSNATLFLVLSILLNLNPIFVFLCRKKELGMPPRRPAPNAYIPPQNGWQNASYTPPQNTWQAPPPVPPVPPVPPRAEPWQAPNPTNEPWEKGDKY